MFFRVKFFFCIDVYHNMVDFNEKIPIELPKLPDDYWSNNKSAKKDVSEINIFDKNLNASLEDISVFKNKIN